MVIKIDIFLVVNYRVTAIIIIKSEQFYVSNYLPRHYNFSIHALYYLLVLHCFFCFSGEERGQSPTHKNGSYMLERRGTETPIQPA